MNGVQIIVFALGGIVFLSGIYWYLNLACKILIGRWIIEDIDTKWFGDATIKIFFLGLFAFLYIINSFALESILDNFSGLDDYKEKISNGLAIIFSTLNMAAFHYASMYLDEKKKRDKYKDVPQIVIDIVESIESMKIDNPKDVVDYEKTARGQLNYSLQNKGYEIDRKEDGKIKSIISKYGGLQVNIEHYSFQNRLLSDMIEDRAYK